MTKRKYDEAIEELRLLLADIKQQYEGLRNLIEVKDMANKGWVGYIQGRQTSIHILETLNTQSDVTTLELAQAYAEPERFITETTPLLVREVYRINPTFHAIVTKHEVAGSAYLKALEETVVTLASEIARRDIATMNQAVFATDITIDKLTAWAEETGYVLHKAGVSV